EIGAFGEDVDDFPLALVAPLGADDHDAVRLRSEHTPPTPGPSKKRPGESGRWSILWWKLDPLERACNSRGHLAHALERQPLDGIAGRVDDPRGGPIATHDRDALPCHRAEGDTIDEHRQPAPPASVYGTRDSVDRRTRPMHQRNGAAPVVDAVEVHDRRVHEKVGPFPYDRPRSHEPIFLGVREDDAHPCVGWQRIYDSEDRDDASPVVHSSGRIVGRAVTEEERRPNQARRAEHGVDDTETGSAEQRSGWDAG